MLVNVKFFKKIFLVLFFFLISFNLYANEKNKIISQLIDLNSLEFTFDQSIDKDDLSFENILIDKASADLLKGSEIDYVSELIGEQFKITNPQTKSSCGCGVSFSL